MEVSEVTTNLRAGPRHRQPFNQRWLRQYAYLFALLVPTLLTALFSSCQHSDEPLIQQIPYVGGYFLYAANWGFDEVYVIDMDSLTVVDTLRGFGSVEQVAVTRDRSTLFVSSRLGLNRPGTLHAVDLKTRQVRLLGEFANIYVGAQGSILAVSGQQRSPHRAVGWVDPLSLSIAYFDSLDIRDEADNDQAIALDEARGILYAQNNAKQLFSYDWVKKEIMKVYKSVYSPYHYLLMEDRRQLVSPGGTVTDVQLDSTWSFGVGNPGGLAERSLDGSVLYMTDPQRLEHITSGRLWLFALTSFSIIGSIDVNVYSPVTGGPTKGIATSMDGKTAFVSEEGPTLYVLDLIKRERRATIIIEPGKCWLGTLAIGRKYNLRTAISFQAITKRGSHEIPSGRRSAGRDSDCVGEFMSQPNKR